MKGHLLGLIIIIASIGMIEAVKFIYNSFKKDDELIDLRRRLGRD